MMMIDSGRFDTEALFEGAHMVGHFGAEKVKAVHLDGKEIPLEKVHFVSEKRGVILRYKSDFEGKNIVHEGYFVSEILFGDVKVTLKG